MADIFVTEELTDDTEGNSDPTEPQPQVQIVIEEADESQEQLDNSQSIAESEKSSDMTLKEDEPESDQFVTDGLLVNPDDLLPPIVKLEKYAQSEVSYNRQTVIRNLLDILRAVQGDPDHVSRIVTLMVTLSEDYDPIVRSELMGQFPQIASFFKEKGANLDSLWPILINSLGTENCQVRKAAHTTLLSVVEENLIDIETVTQKICPLVVHLTESIHHEELRINCIMLMSKLAVLLGKKITEELFLPCIFTLCEDKVNIRKTCALAFGDICTTVGRETTEKYLLPKFITLCMDTAWGVRKACAESFMPVSCVVSRETRCKELAEIYKTFLNDLSRWVRVTAYQGLGPFISTFAEPEKTGLYYSKDGVLTIDIPESPEVDKNEIFVCNEKLDNKNQCLLGQSCKSRKENFDTPEDTGTSDVNVSSIMESDGRPIPKTNHIVFSEMIVPDEKEEKIRLNNSFETHCASKAPSNLCNESQNSVSHEPDCDTNIVAKSMEEESYVSDIALSTEVNKDKFYIKMYYGTKIGGNRYNFSCAEMHSASDIPGIPCHVGNYCSVGETAPVADIEVDASNEIPQLNGRLCFSEEDTESELLNECSNISEINEQPYSDLISLKDCDPCNSQNKTQNLRNNLKPYSELDISNNSCSEVLVNGDVNVLPADSSNGWYSCEAEEAITFSNNLSHKGNEKKPLNGMAKSELNYANTKTGSLYVENNNLNKEMKFIENEEDPIKFREGCYSESNAEITEDSAFNYFQYWRPPLEDINIEVINSEDDTKKSDSSAYPLRFLYKKFLQEQSQCQQLNSDQSYEGEIDEISENKEGEPPPSSHILDGGPLFSAYDQDIVPASLLNSYLGMTDKRTEVAHHCAYSLPAVAFTLGRKNWPCLRETFNELSSDLQNFIMMWKIRRTVASSMHQLAVILGPEITTKDLIPVFSKFIYDLDEVRIGILQHISEFLKVLQPEERKTFLPSLSEFLEPNSHSDSSEKNWRFRLILAEQLVLVADLYEPQDVKDHLVPLAITLVQDKICEVRLASVRVLAAVFRRMSQHPTPELTKEVLSDITEKFIHSPKWIHRQLYVYLCQEFVIKRSLPPEQFAEDVLPHLLYLCWDRVPNIRIATARCLASVIWPLETFSGPESPYRELLLQAIHTLQGDSDADVQFYAYMVSTHECSCLVHDVFTNLPV